MNTPRHYTAFRIVLVVVVLAVLAAIVLGVADPRLQTAVLEVLGVAR